MNTALLTPVHNTISDKWFYVWETPNEKTISKEFNTKEEALRNKPQHFKCRDDGWNLI